MEFKIISVFFWAYIFIVVNTTPLPRDSSVARVEPIVFNDDSTVKEADVESPELRKEVNILGRVSCQYEETTEDPVCQEHCFPKGYKYGLCVSGICSCV